MEVYIESVFLQQALLHGICFLSALILVNKTLVKKQWIIYLILISLISFNLYIKLPSLVIYLLIFLFHLYLYKKESLLFYCSYMISYAFFIFILLKINTYATFKWGLLIIYKFTHIFPMVILLITVLLFYLGHAFFLKRNLALKQLCYPIEFTYRGQTYQLEGYLDTGNQATQQGIPIIFVKKGILNSHSEERIQINTVSGESNIAIYYVRNIKIGNVIYLETYLGEVDNLVIEQDCLLNVALLYKG